MSNIITCEQVSKGHPDKIADQIADAIVSDCLRHDKDSRVGVEALIKDDYIAIAGEITSEHCPDYEKLVAQVFNRIGRDRLGYDMSEPYLKVWVSRQSPDIAQGVDTGGAGDQGMQLSSHLPPSQRQHLLLCLHRARSRLRSPLLCLLRYLRP